MVLSLDTSMTYLCQACATQAPSTRIRISLNPQLFLCGFGFRSHVSSESSKRIRNSLNPLSRMEIFEYAMNNFIPRENLALPDFPGLCRASKIDSKAKVIAFS